MPSLVARGAWPAHRVVQALESGHAAAVEGRSYARRGHLGLRRETTEEDETRSSLLIDLSQKEDSDSVLAKTSGPIVPVTRTLLTHTSHVPASDVLRPTQVALVLNKLGALTLTLTLSVNF